MRQSTQWSVSQAALIGAIIGSAASVSKAIIIGDSGPLEFWIGMIAGSGVAGAFLFVVGTAIRNAFVK